MSKLKFGVPCSKIKDCIEDVEVNCSTEEEAMSIAAGVWLAGKEPNVYMQNSGLCRVLDHVLSLYHPYEIPLPKLILSIRHKPYHHKFCGEVTRDVLDLLNWKNVEITEQEK
jgi:sulfopyruvate decarboxylase TPP-binding subunit